jgi:hypothetical protein
VGIKPKNRGLLLLIASSFLVFSACVVLRVGLGNTPYDTTDSQGRTMRFNDRLSAEHYGIIFKNFTITPLFSTEFAYEWLLLAMHFSAAWLLMSRHSSSRATKWFFAIQPLIFPLGILSLLILYQINWVFLTGRMDREGIIDIPFIWCVAHPPWVLVSIVILLLLRGQTLGIRESCNAVRKGRLLSREITDADAPLH